MECQATVFDIEPSVRALIRVKAAQLLRAGYDYRPDERDDLQQDLWLDAYVRSRKFDKARSGRHTFLSRVVNNRVANLIAERRAGCRDYRACVRSLDEPDGQDGLRRFGETLSADEYESRMGRRSMPWVQHAELRADVARVIALLPPDLAAVASLLMSVGVVEVSRRLNLPRVTVYRRIVRIREVFLAAGLHGYLPRCSSLSSLLDSSATD